MTASEVTSWRRAERRRLIAAREALDAAALARLRARIDAHLDRSFPGLAGARLAFCWPVRGEYDARPLAAALRAPGPVTAPPRLRARGAGPARPAGIAPAQPLVFREWHPGVALVPGPFGIPFPPDSRAVLPTVVLLPMNGWDEAGHRLGYGSGLFDRTLASLAT